MQSPAARTRKLFNCARTVRFYQQSTELQLPEAVILDRLRADFTRKRVLDIGVGAGRTTGHLLELSQHYIGLDYSSRMIESCRARYPGVSFMLCDARDLSLLFGKGSFDLVLFSYNGIDVLDHADRLKALSGIRDILSPTGAFVFSSHNLDYRRAHFTKPWDPRLLPFDINPFVRPLPFVKKLATYPIGIANYLRVRKHERTETHYSILGDEAHKYNILTYYIAPRCQVAQLTELGFRDTWVIGLDGRSIGEAEYAGAIRDHWLYYVGYV